MCRPVRLSKDFVSKGLGKGGGGIQLATSMPSGAQGLGVCWTFLQMGGEVESRELV